MWNSSYLHVCSEGISKQGGEGGQTQHRHQQNRNSTATTALVPVPQAVEQQHMAWHIKQSIAVLHRFCTAKSSMWKSSYLRVCSEGSSRQRCLIKHRWEQGSTTTALVLQQLNAPCVRRCN
jgi:hypothetical protein